MGTHDLSPMHPEGKWIRTANGAHHFIVNPDHQQRLLQEGGRYVDDPRSPPQTEREVHVQAGDIEIDISEELPEKHAHAPHRRHAGGR